QQFVLARVPILLGIERLRWRLRTLSARGVNRAHWIAACIIIQIQPTVKPNRVLGEKPPGRRVVVPLLKIIQPQPRVGPAPMLRLVTPIAPKLELSRVVSIRSPCQNPLPERVIPQRRNEAVRPPIRQEPRAPQPVPV